MLALSFLAFVAGRSSDLPAVRALLHLVDLGWPRHGAIAVAYPTPLGRSFQVSLSDHRAHGLTDVRERDVIFRMRFDVRNRLLAVEETIPMTYERGTLWRTPVARIVAEELAKRFDLGGGVEIGDLHADRDGYFLGLGSIGRHPGDIGLVYFSKTGRYVRSLAGW